ncbi:peroxiredoxin-like family protein [Dictyobacter arantiisoli]|uniref:thioredoxin-dependent peroxiredoxin n=1 Tax=Dictyobacter arantiisoli TaxID=2014874 RepID=A0A5A5TK10_9CHLR|nr:peroxiredoxin-like family protein [Dictyobacter arantiisoli]GCF11416.1 alkyl hydroperoxide reductase [Dictyobacter arantiisoli]
MTAQTPKEQIANTVLSMSPPSDLPLQEQLDILKDQVYKLMPEDAAKESQKTLESLVNSGMVEKALKENNLAPDFTLPNALNQRVTLSHLLEQGPVVLVFYRGGWCPFCNLELRAYQKLLPAFQALGVTLVALSPMLPDHSLTTAEKQHLAFPVLSDVGNQVARQFGLVFQMDEQTRKRRARLGGANLPEYNGDDSWEVPIPGTFLIDQSRTIRLAFVDADITRRLEPSIVLARLKELKGESE